MAQARPLNKAVLAAPVPPAPSTTQLTVPVGVELRSAARATERQQFDAAVAGKQQDTEAEGEREAQAMRAREEDEVRALRAQLQHKAQPLPAFYGHGNH